MNAVRAIDLRSDTFSTPSEAMYEALQAAPLGDDVYEEDPTVKRLEKLAAEKTGKEAALLVTSGTQGNLVSLLSHCRPGAEVILGARTDLCNWETSGLSLVAGLMPRAIDDSDGCLDPDEVRATIRDDSDIHVNATGAICVENSHQRSSGRPVPLDRLAEIASIARDAGVPVHMDGARLFNSAVALGVPASSIAAHADSVSFCLSKGLSCPVGSVLCGSGELIGQARRMRKVVGGGMRQAGWIAAAGLVALDAGIARLEEDHRNARSLARGLADVPGVVTDPSQVQTNIVYFALADDAPDAASFLGALAELGVLAFPMGERLVRMVTYRNIDAEDVERAIAAVGTAVAAAAAGDGARVAAGPYAT